MNYNTKKMNLFGNYETQNINELDDFMKRYNASKQGLKADFTTKDFDILINEINKLKEINLKNKNVIQSLDNDNNELKSELKKYKIEYQKLYKSYKNLQTKAFIPKKKIQQITEHQIQEIKNLRKNGLSYSEIERQTKWSKYTISRVLNGHYDTK